MATTQPDATPSPVPPAVANGPQFLGHPTGLFLLFLVEMWERFSYYGMRGLLVLYLTTPLTGMRNPPKGQLADFNPGRGWDDASASTLYGWYTGLAYLLPIFGGMIADKLIGTHRSMVVGALIIALGHIVLAISGIDDWAKGSTGTGMSLFVFGLVLIVLGTGHFKPSVSVMVGQLYAPGDARRDSAFSIFYMGINLGAFLCNIVCGYLAYNYGWHWGFGAAAVGMLAGLVLYIAARPKYLAGIGEPPPGKGGSAPLFAIGAIGVSALFALIFHMGWIGQAWGVIGKAIDSIPNGAIVVPVAMLGVMIVFCAWFVSINRPEDRGPVATIFIFMFFNAFFWIAFEQAGSSLTLFTDRYTDRTFMGSEIDTPMFQSVNPLLIILGAPLFAVLWRVLAAKRMMPSQPVKIALGLFFLGLGYVFIFWGAKQVQVATDGTAVLKASMFFVVAGYFWHTVGELFLSPTGLSYVTKAAPIRFVSLLMGVWFVSSFIANLGGGLLAAQVEKIEKGELKLPWSFAGYQANFFFLFIVTSVGAGVLILLLTPILKRMMRNPND